jgi:hypothetical protein
MELLIIFSDITNHIINYIDNFYNFYSRIKINFYKTYFIKILKILLILFVIHYFIKYKIYIL